MSKPSQKRRYYAVDALRGLSILLMVAYHFGYNLVMFDIAPPGLLYNPLLNFLQPFFASVFIAISGASSTFSHSNLRRGVKILLCAALVTWPPGCLTPRRSCDSAFCIFSAARPCCTKYFAPC